MTAAVRAARSVSVSSAALIQKRWAANDEAAADFDDREHLLVIELDVQSRDRRLFLGLGYLTKSRTRKPVDAQMPDRGWDRLSNGVYEVIFGLQENIQKVVRVTFEGGEDVCKT